MQYLLANNFFHIIPDAAAPSSNITNVVVKEKKTKTTKIKTHSLIISSHCEDSRTFRSIGWSVIVLLYFLVVGFVENRGNDRQAIKYAH